MAATRKKRGTENRGILAADVGGTNTRIGIYEADSLRSLHRIALFSSKTSKTSLFAALKKAAAYAKKRGIALGACCVVAAGTLKRGEIKLTNTHASLSVQGIANAVALPSSRIVLVNDFLGQAWGAQKTPHLHVIRKGRAKKKGSILVIGAGTGLGKASLVWDSKKKSYRAIPSEDGHTPLLFREGEEHIHSFLQKSVAKEEGRRASRRITWEDALSGRGLVRLCLFSYQEAGDSLPSALKGKGAAKWISIHAKGNIHCKRAFGLFAHFYVRFAATLAKKEGPLGGIYFTGGILQKNPFIVSREEFREGIRTIAHHIPLYLITDAHNGLFGAAVVASQLLKQKGI